MAELDDIINALKNLDSTQITKAFDDLKTKASSASDVVGILSDKVDDLTQSAKQLKESAFGAFQAFNLTGVIQNFASTNKELVNMASQIGLIGLAIKSNIQADAFSTIGESARGSTSDINETIETVNKLFGIRSDSKNPLAMVLRGMEEVIKLGDPTKQFEAGLIQSAAASGQLGDLLKSMGNDLSGLSLKAEKFSEMTYQIANASGLTQKQVAVYAKELLKIPGAMDMTIESTEKGVQDIHLLDATMKIAAGTGESFTDVFDQMNTVYQEFNTTGKQALEYVTRISAASQALKIPLDGVRSYTENSARSFRFFADNSQAAITILERFGPALKESGLGPKAIEELVGNVTQSISQLNIAQKAFLSGQTGGPRGLQGGYQIELLLQQGKLDEVQAKVEESLRKQFGGRIVTLEEAAKNAQAAGQFTKEVQLLTQGPTKIAGSEAEAYRILDTFAKGPASKGVIKPPEMAFKEALATGDALQERQYNVLSKIQNETERATQLASISAYNLTRLVAGTERKDLGEVVSEARLKSSELTAATGKLVSGEGSLEGGKRVNEVIGDFFASFEREGTKTTGGLNAFKDNLLKGIAEPFLAGNKSNLGGPIITEKIGGALGAAEEKLEITVHSLCEKCFTQIAEQKATKVGKQLIQQNEANKAISVHTGQHSGL